MNNHQRKGGITMNYYFATDNKSKRHILVASSLEEAKTIASNSITVENIYELLPDTFDTEGFLVSDK